MSCRRKKKNVDIVTRSSMFCLMPELSMCIILQRMLSAQAKQGQNSWPRGILCSHTCCYGAESKNFSTFIETKQD